MHVRLSIEDEHTYRPTWSQLPSDEFRRTWRHGVIAEAVVVFLALAASDLARPGFISKQAQAGYAAAPFTLACRSAQASSSASNDGASRAITSSPSIAA